MRNVEFQYIQSMDSTRAANHECIRRWRSCLVGPVPIIHVYITYIYCLCRKSELLIFVNLFFEILHLFELPLPHKYDWIRSDSHTNKLFAFLCRGDDDTLWNSQKGISDEF